ncbi:hypothetical protein [Rathayibacter sp. AY1E2]|uniref:hypothetical protein n=1 Tax=Rathayibacter sp. AY1E2 TaxID=2080550 RepID=UPI000CE90CB7|nr:hypothetical protein [Rathayibacter sp. AY1E2]PPH51284.1 hypothetical protein C5C49_12445 [Rathayibacter sp. AY1E2]
MEISARRLAARDAVAVVAVLAALEGALAVDSLPPGLEEILLHQFERSSLVLPGADRDELASALRALDARVRDALG